METICCRMLAIFLMAVISAVTLAAGNNISDASTTVAATIIVPDLGRSIPMNSEKRWWKGSIHCHSHYSDGNEYVSVRI